MSAFLKYLISLSLLDLTDVAGGSDILPEIGSAFNQCKNSPTSRRLDLGS